MLMRIVLHLARSRDYPEGSTRIGYEIIAPLDRQGRLDAIEWHAKRALCRVHRFAPGEEATSGALVHRAGGVGGATWLFDFDPSRTSDDETGYRLDSHVLRVGEYVSLADARRHQRTFVVAEVGPALTVREPPAKARRTA